MPFLNGLERHSVLMTLIATVEQRFAEPKLNGVNFRQIAEERARGFIENNPQLGGLPRSLWLAAFGRMGELTAPRFEATSPM